jgi:hypothetical protein
MMLIFGLYANFRLSSLILAISSKAGLNLGASLAFFLFNVYFFAFSAKPFDPSWAKTFTLFDTSSRAFRLLVPGGSNLWIRR